MIGRADSLVRSSRYTPHLAALLLADTWVVGSLSDAVRIVHESPGTVRAITPQGELVEKDGTLHTGMTRSETAIVSRKSELRRLKKELHRVEHQIAEWELQLQRLAAEMETIESNLVDVQQTVTDSTERCRTAEQDHSETLQLLTFSEQRIERLQNQLQQVRKELESLTTLRRTVTEEHEAETIQLKELRRSLAEYETSFTERQQQLEQLEQGRTESSLEFTRLEERALSFRKATDRLRDELYQRRLQQQEASRRLSGGRSRVRALTLAKLNVRAELAELYVAEDVLWTRGAEHSFTRELLRNRRHEASQLETEVRERCSKYEQQNHALELEIIGIQHQLATSAERIHEEFQITIEDALRQGCSALSVWMNRLHTDAHTDRETVTVANPSFRLRN